MVTMETAEITTLDVTTPLFEYMGINFPLIVILTGCLLLGGMAMAVLIRKPFVIGLPLFCVASMALLYLFAICGMRCCKERFLLLRLWRIC